MRTKHYIIEICRFDDVWTGRGPGADPITYPTLEDAQARMAELRKDGRYPPTRIVGVHTTVHREVFDD